MKVAALTPYPEDAPSTRFRLAQFREPLREEGIELGIEAATGSERLQRVYDGASLLGRGRVAIRGIVKRWRRLVGPDLPDLFLVHRELGPVLGKQLLRRLRGTGVPYVYDFDDAVFLPSPGRDPVLGALRRPRRDTADLCRHARVVLAGNDHLADFARSVRGAGGNDPDVVTLPTVVDTHHFRPARDGTVDSPSIPPLVGWVGSHTTIPDLLTLLPALREARRRVDFRLRVVCNREPPPADGIDLEYVRWSPEREVEVLQDLDVGLYPLDDSPWSRGKCGFKAIEYLACGVPTVASPVGVLPRIVQDRETGFLARSEGEWVEALVKLLEEPALARRLGENGRRLVVRSFSVEAVLPTLVDSLRRAAEGDAAHGSDPVQGAG